MTADRPRLYHAASSYYSMIARLALVENAVAFTSVPVDIHRRKQQFEPDFVRRNPGMTVPALTVGSATFGESRAIALHAFGTTEEGLDPETRAWLDRHWAFPIEELTFGSFLASRPLARWVVPRSLAGIEKKLRSLAIAHPDLRAAYLARAEVFAGRVRTFDPDAAVRLFRERRAEAIAILDVLETTLRGGRGYLAGERYGPADVVFTVFLARMCFVHLEGELDRSVRPEVARYMAAMFARPSFAAADVWAKMSVVKLLGQIFGS